jgi:hypothetical protein
VLENPDFKRLAFKNNQDFGTSLFLTKPTAHSATIDVKIPYSREALPWSRVLNCAENVANIRSQTGSLKEKATALMDRWMRINLFSTFNSPRTNLPSFVEPLRRPFRAIRQTSWHVSKENLKPCTWIVKRATT